LPYSFGAGPTHLFGFFLLRRSRSIDWQVSILFLSHTINKEFGKTLNKGAIRKEFTVFFNMKGPSFIEESAHTSVLIISK
jgi:hypothetical protein